MSLFTRTDTALEEELVPVREIPAVQEAEAAVAGALQRYDAAKAENQQIPAGQISMDAIMVDGKEKETKKAYEKALRDKDELVAREREHIWETRMPGLRAVRREMIAGGHHFKELVEAILQYKNETARLTGGRDPNEVEGADDLASLFVDTPQQESRFSAYLLWVETQTLL